MVMQNRSLRNIVFRAITVPAMAGLLILAGVIFLSLRLIYTGIVDRQDILIESMAQQGNRFLTETGQLMKTLAATLVDLPVENQTKLLAESRHNYPRFTAFYLLDETGRVILEDTDTFALLDLDLSGERYFQTVRQSGKIYFSDPFLSLSSGQTSMTAAVPIFADQQFQGILVGELSLDLRQQQIIEQADLGERSISFVVDRRGTLLAHPNQEFVQERRHYGDLPLVEAGLAGHKTVKFFYDDDQQAWLIGSATTMTPGWVVVTMQPFVAVAQPIMQMLIIAGIALGLSLVVFFVVQRRSLRQITKPIAVLAQKADALAGGQYEVLSSRQMGECREIVSLGYSFAGMVEAVQERDQTVARQLEELKQADAETRWAQTFLDAIVENIPDMIFVKNAAELNFVLCNKAAEELMGFSREELVGKNDFDFFPKEEAVFFTAKDRETLAGKELLDIPEETIQTRHKGLRILHTKKLPILEKDGQPQFLLGISEDITERKQAEEEIDALNRFREAVIDNALASLNVLDTNTNILVWNKAAEEITGYSRGEVVGHNKIWQWLYPDQAYREKTVKNAQKVITGGMNRSNYETDIRTKAGQIKTIAWYGRGLQDDAGEPIGSIAIGVDVTERKQAEEEIRKLNEVLEQRVIERTAQLEVTNKELEAFAYSVSHDLRAPLRSINGFGQIILEDHGDKLGTDGRDCLQRIRAASQRMGQLIDDLLKLSRMTRGELHYEPVDLTGLAHEIAAELQRSQPERQVEFVIISGLQTKGDRQLLRVVLDNLLGNAWKFTGEQAQANIEFGCINDNGHRTFYVRDNGAGFDMAYADKLFGAFQRLHTATEFEGTGIGLATVQRIIHRHGGRVWPEGEVDRGATFYFSLSG